MAREVGKDRYKKAKSAREVSISQTSWKKDTGAGPKGKAGRLVGPGGKLFTGTVKTQDGTKVVYEKGKRVTRRMTEGGGVTKAQAASKSKTVTPPSTTKKDAPPKPKPSPRGEERRQPGAIKQVTPSQGSSRASSAESARLTAQSKSNGRRLNTDAAMPYQAAGAKAKLQKAQAEARKKQESKTTVQSFAANITAKPKKGATKETANSKMVWDGARWVRTHIRKKGPSGRSYWVKL